MVKTRMKKKIIEAQCPSSEARRARERRRYCGPQSCTENNLARPRTLRSIRRDSGALQYTVTPQSKVAASLETHPEDQQYFQPLVFPRLTAASCG